METGKNPASQAIVAIVPRATALPETVGPSASRGLDRVAKRVQELVTADLAEVDDLRAIGRDEGDVGDPFAPNGQNYGVIRAKVLRLIQSGHRLGSLLADLDWCECRMPENLAAPFAAEGRLASLVIDGDPAHASGPTTIYVTRMRMRTVARAVRWLLDELTGRIA